MTWRWYNDDRAIAVDVVARRKAEVRAAFEPILLIANVGEGFAELTLSSRADELVLLGRDPYRHTGKVGQAADVVPVCMSQKNGA